MKPWNGQTVHWTRTKFQDRQTYLILSTKRRKSSRKSKKKNGSRQRNRNDAAGRGRRAEGPQDPFRRSGRTETCLTIRKPSCDDLEGVAGVPRYRQRLPRAVQRRFTPGRNSGKRVVKKYTKSIHFKKVSGTLNKERTKRTCRRKAVKARLRRFAVQGREISAGRPGSRHGAK